MAKAFSRAEFQAATKRGAAKAKLPSALLKADLDERSRSLMLRFRSGVAVVVPTKAIREIAKEPLSKIRDVKASPLGDGLLFEEVGELIYVPGLLRDLFGDAFTAALGKIGGKAKSPAKTAAARANGAKGGRPKKNAA